MHEISSKIFKTLTVASTFAVAAACGPQNRDPSSSIHVEPRDCDFSHADVLGSFCQRSLYALIAKPEDMYGQPVFTYGFLRKNPDGTFALSPLPKTPKVIDFKSCLLVLAEPDKRYLSIEEGRFYSASVAGELKASKTGICSGVISNAQLVEWEIED